MSTPKPPYSPGTALTVGTALSGSLPSQVFRAQAAGLMGAIDVDLKTAVAEVSRVAARYGDAGKAGWSPLPDVLLFNQHKLGIDSRELNVLLHMMAHFYTPGAMPFVRANVIAKRMGANVRSVQRTIARLRKKRLISKSLGPKRQVVHDLSPLLERLQPFARARMADKEARQALKQKDALLQIAGV